MKKRKLVLTGLVGFAFLFGCNQIEPTNEVKASLPNGYVAVTETDYKGGDTFIEVKHIQTGCHYTYVNAYQTVAFTQMFIEKDESSVPYCEDRGK